jgi:hypothetical protein
MKAVKNTVIFSFQISAADLALCRAEAARMGLGMSEFFRSSASMRVPGMGSKQHFRKPVPEKPKPSPATADEGMRRLLAYLRANRLRHTVKGISIGVGKRTSWTSEQLRLADSRGFLRAWGLTAAGSEFLDGKNSPIDCACTLP